MKTTAMKKLVSAGVAGAVGAAMCTVLAFAASAMAATNVTFTPLTVSVQAGQTFTVVAELVDNEPVLTRVGDDKWRQGAPPGQVAPAPDARVGEPAEPEPAAEFLPVPKEQQEAWSKAKHLVGRNASLAALALRKAARLADEWSVSEGLNGSPRGPMPGELLAAVYGTMLYGANAGLPVLNLPVSVNYQTLEIVPKKVKAK